MNKAIEFLFEHFPEIAEETRKQMQSVEETMTGEEGKEKKKEVDNRIIDFSANLIRQWDIPQVPNFIEDPFLDPMTIKALEIYIPQLTQGLYDVGIKGIKKINNELKN